MKSQHSIESSPSYFQQPLLVRLLPSFLRNMIQARLERWWDSMAPISKRHTLTRKNVYIFPNARGIGYLIVTMVLWLIGTNYQNNLVLGAAFLMAALFVVGIMHTYLNLKGLVLNVKGAQPVFAGESAHFLLKLSNPTSRNFDSVELFWQRNHSGGRSTSIDANSDTIVEVAFPTARRGWLKPGRLCLQTDYPLGLIRCWTWVNLECQVLVYPAPVEVPEPKSSSIEGDTEMEHPIKGGEDFSGLDKYRAGDPLKNIAWKASARGKGLYVKEYSQNESRELWLDYLTISASGLEEKIAGMCFWALEYDKSNENYGLNLPGLKVEPAAGDAHTQHILKELAQFETAGEATPSGRREAIA